MTPDLCPVCGGPASIEGIPQFAHAIDCHGRCQRQFTVASAVLPALRAAQNHKGPLASHLDELSEALRRGAINTLSDSWDILADLALWQQRRSGDYWVR
jgi:hypothetical protein